jgi:hypothetical protein
MKFDNCSKLKNDLQVANPTKHSERSSWEHNFWFASQKETAFYVPCKLITEFTRTLHYSPSLCFLQLHFLISLILLLILCRPFLDFPGGLFLSNFSANVCSYFWSLQCVLQIPPTVSSLKWHPNNIWQKKYKLWSSLWHIHRSSVTSWLLGTKNLLRTLFLTLWSPHYFVSSSNLVKINFLENP